MTNSHVVRQSDKVQIRFYSGEEMVGHVIGTDEETDLAVIQVKSSKPLPSVSLGDSSKVKVGQFVVAIGNPYGLHDTFSFGVVSGLNRENVNISRYEDFIQTDASINPGNSGGPLLNIRGEVIGINTAIINYAQSIGFAIPSNVVKKVAQQIIETGSVRRGWLGVGIEYIPEDIAKSSNIDTNDGVLINSVFDGQPAAKAGLKVGDIIMKIGGASVKSPNAMIRLIGNFSPGQVVDLKILRNGVAKTFSVRLDRKEDPEHKIAALERNKFSFLGFEWDDISSVSSEKGSGAQGVLVTRVYPHSQAERAGVKSGDVITAVNGQTIADKDGFIRNMRQAPRNELITLQVDRNNTSIQFELKHF
ncbi:MAG: PDZ domain-containing protein [Nitrospinaceae bacterium]|nr:PDZ domain-containing protein [Nitrospinaceae bacterium]